MTLEKEKENLATPGLYDVKRLPNATYVGRFGLLDLLLQRTVNVITVNVKSYCNQIRKIPTNHRLCCHAANYTKIRGIRVICIA